MPKRHHPADRYHPRSRARVRHAGASHPNVYQVERPLHERARIVVRLAAASHALAERPDVAALLLDGALIDMLNVWAQAALGPAREDIRDRQRLADALDALDQRAPVLSGRLRLALQAHDPAARLAHCRTLLDLLTASTAAPQAHLHSVAAQRNNHD